MWQHDQLHYQVA